jgi:hypothetical protein
VTLNAGQEAAADGFFEFLFSDQRESIISGPGGVGKTFLMSHLIDEIMPRYFDTCQLMGVKPEYDQVVMTATTNKAAEVLAVGTSRPCDTIHSFLNLKVTDDYTTGQQKLTPTLNWFVHERKILFIDECSMIDFPLLQLIREGTHNSKIVYVGDHCQLAPVMKICRSSSLPSKCEIMVSLLLCTSATNFGTLSKPENSSPFKSYPVSSIGSVMNKWKLKFIKTLQLRHIAVAF